MNDPVLGKPKAFTQQKLTVWIHPLKSGFPLVFIRHGVFSLYEKLLSDYVLGRHVLDGMLPGFKRVFEAPGLYVWTGLVVLGSEGGHEFRGTWREATDVECLAFARGRFF